MLLSTYSKQIWCLNFRSHKRDFVLKELRGLFLHIEKQFDHSFELFKRGDSIGSKFFAVGSHSPGCSCDLETLEILLQEGSRVKRGGAVQSKPG